MIDDANKACVDTFDTINSDVTLKNRQCLQFSLALPHVGHWHPKLSAAVPGVQFFPGPSTMICKLLIFAVVVSVVVSGPVSVVVSGPLSSLDDGDDVLLEMHLLKSNTSH
jgi:hypothetical protein